MHQDSKLFFLRRKIHHICAEDHRKIPNFQYNILAMSRDNRGLPKPIPSEISFLNQKKNKRIYQKSPFRPRYWSKYIHQLKRATPPGSCNSQAILDLGSELPDNDVPGNSAMATALNDELQIAPF
jgi:hypothetical protein